MGKYYINHSDCTDLTNQVKTLIAGATSYIKISSFLMKDRELVEMLKVVSKKGIAAVFVLSNLNDDTGEDNYHPNLISDLESNEKYGINSHHEYLQELQAAGIHVRLIQELHAKFLVVDGKEGLLMSANFAPGSLEKNRNVETGISLCEIDTINLEYIFDTMYKYADIVNYVADTSKDIIEKNNKKASRDAFDGLKGNIRLTVCGKKGKSTNLSNLSIKSLYTQIISIINDANEYLYIIAYSFKSYKYLKQFIDAIKEARNRNVKIQIICNKEGRNENVFNNKMQFLDKLIAMGCEVYFAQNHSKCIINEKEGMLFTANIDGQNGLLNGFEVGCLFDDEQHELARQHIMRIINNAEQYGNQ